jgi:hypothetical protein
MLSFRSEVFPDFFPNKFGYHSKILLMGSCFTENIGKKLQDLKFPVVLNPFGILYNPASIAQSLFRLLEPEQYQVNDLIFFNEKWVSLAHHGRFSCQKAEETIDLINSELMLGAKSIEDCSVLFITFGTSWVYLYKKDNKVVANCHKIPSDEFEHYSLSISEIVEMYAGLLETIHSRNQHIKVVFTVSPVRHWKDGPVNNQYSKSILIVAIQELIKKFDFISYFPSYEIFMDDLRDYRFYADDLFHPNKIGIDYVWQKFSESFIDESALNTANKIDKINKALAHSPFYPKTNAYLKFLEANLKMIEELRTDFPNLHFAEEIKHFNSEKEKYFKAI